MGTPPEQPKASAAAAPVSQKKKKGASYPTIRLLLLKSKTKLKKGTCHIVFFFLTFFFTLTQTLQATLDNNSPNLVSRESYFCLFFCIGCYCVRLVSCVKDRL